MNRKRSYKSFLSGQTSIPLRTKVRYKKQRDDINNSITESVFINVDQPDEESSSDDEIVPRQQESALSNSPIRAADDESIETDSTESSDRNSRLGDDILSTESDESDEELEQDDNFAHVDFNSEGINGFKVFEILIMVMSFALRHSLSFEAIVDFLNLLNNILKIPKFPTSKYLLKKIFNAKDNLTYNFACKMCKGLIVSLTSYENSLNEEMLCEDCGTHNTLKHCHVFITTSIESQIISALKCNEISTQLVNRTLAQSNDVICDITSGSAYETLKNSVNLKPWDLTLTFNTDGIQAFKSSTASIWPILAIINEFPISTRISEMIIAGVWFGTTEPCMQTFLKPFVNELIKLQNGFTWQYYGKKICSRVFALCCCVDSKARAPLMGMSQFNAKYGCPWCYHPGSLIKTTKNPKGAIKYSVVNGEYNSRCDADVREHMMQAMLENRVIMGAKHLSVLSRLPKFDMCFGFIIDYMHCVLLGVIKALIILWIASNYLNEYYIGSPQNIDLINKRLMAIQINRNIHRKPRKISDYAQWKASELENFLLYYCLIVLKDILPEIYYEHLSLLSGAIFTLLKKEVSNVELDACDTALKQFVNQYEELYGVENMRFNVHQLLHLTDTVRRFGPLWAHSCYPFESANNMLLQQVNGATGVVHQIIHRFKIRDTISSIVAKKKDEISEYTKSYLRRLSEYNNKVRMPISTSNNNCHLDCTVVSNTKVQELKTEFPNVDKFYTKGMIFNKLIVTKENNSRAMRNDSFIKLVDGNALEVLFLATTFNSNNVLFIGYMWTLLPVNENAPQYHYLAHRSDRLISKVINSDNFLKMMYINCSNTIYVVEVQNVLGQC